MKEGGGITKLNDARDEVIDIVRDYGQAEVNRSEGDIGGTDLSDVEAALMTFATVAGADERAKVREAIARAIESQINEADLSASQSAANEALRMAARIARGK